MIAARPKITLLIDNVRDVWDLHAFMGLLGLTGSSFFLTLDFFSRVFLPVPGILIDEIVLIGDRSNIT